MPWLSQILDNSKLVVYTRQSSLRHFRSFKICSSDSDCILDIIFFICLSDIERALTWLPIHVIKNFINSLSANPTKWSNTLKQFVGRQNLTNCLSVFAHFVRLVLKGLNSNSNKCKLTHFSSVLSLYRNQPFAL